MDYLALEKSLQRQVLSPVYLFYGDETFLRDTYVNRFRELVPAEVRDFNLDIIDGRDCGPEAVVGMASTLPFMAEKRVVIVKNAGFFKSKRKGASASEEADEKEEKTGGTETALLNYLENPLDSTCLIFCADGVDRKRKLYKIIEKKGQVVEFAPLKGRDLNEWIDKTARKLGRVIDPRALASLITAVGSDLRQLHTELEKLSCYSSDEKISIDDVETMVSKTSDLSVFELVDAVGERNYRKAIGMAREMVFMGEPVMRLIFMIARQFRLLMRAKDLHNRGYADKQIGAQLQVHPFVAQKCIKQARNFSLAEIRQAMERILAADEDIKSGRQEQVMALELLIIDLCSKKE